MVQRVPAGEPGDRAALLTSTQPGDGSLERSGTAPGLGAGKHEGGMEDLGRRLKEVRVRAGLTLRELARQADVSPSLISQIENGKSQPSVATLYTFSRLLHVSVDELFEDPVQGNGNGTGPSAGDQDRHPSDPTNAWQPSEYANR